MGKKLLVNQGKKSSFQINDAWVTKLSRDLRMLTIAIVPSDKTIDWKYYWIGSSGATASPAENEQFLQNKAMAGFWEWCLPYHVNVQLKYASPISQCATTKRCVG